MKNMESLIIKVGAISILISLIFQERKCERKLSDTLSKAYLVRTISRGVQQTNYLRVLPQFLSFLFSLEPTWDDLKRLKRSHIEPYIQWLHEYSKNKITQKTHTLNIM